MEKLKVKEAKEIFPITSFSVFDFSLDVYGVDDEKCPECHENSLIEIGQTSSMTFVPACIHCCFCGWTREIQLED